MTDNNRRQADIPAGAEPIPHMPGTAPGLYCPIGDKVIYAVPGVPYEMREMMETFILPDMQRRSGQTAVIRSRTLRTWGDSESGLAGKLADRIDQLDGVGNPYPRLSDQWHRRHQGARHREIERMKRLLRKSSLPKQFLRNLLGDIVFGIDEETMETVVLNSLRRQGVTLAVAESLTGGVMSSRLSDIDRNMEVFKSAVISAGHAEAAVGEDRGLTAARHAKETYGTDVGVAVVLPDPSKGPGAAPFISVSCSVIRNILSMWRFPATTTVSAIMPSLA